MASFLINYEAKSSWLDYSGLIRAIKSYQWARLTDHCYIVSSDASSQEIFEKLRPFLDDSANLYVITVRKPFAGFGPQKMNDWLIRHLTEH